MKIAHVAIWTRDIEVMKDFYCTYFKGTANEKYVNDKKGFESYFLRLDGETSIELMRRVDIAGVPAAGATGYAHIAFDVGSREAVDEMTERLAASGLIHRDGPRTTGDGYYESVFLDPEGNMIEITC